MLKKPARWISILAILVVTAVLDINGALAPLDRALLDLRFRILGRPASGTIVVVQIDSRSLQELDVWPWPRGYHAALIDRLMAAGVREIALDIDLSAHSTEDGDRALAAALERAGNRVILPAFRQASSPEARGGEVFDTLPRPLFREHTQIGNINISPASDGLVRVVSDVQTIGGVRLPSVFALLAGPSAIQGRSFLIDYSIDPNTIPRLSYVDVLNGTVGVDRLAGKSVIVGATAAELGDVVPVPVYHSMAGSVLQAMAYESLIQGRGIRTLGPAVSVPVTALLVLILGAHFAKRSWRWALLAAALAMVNLEAAATALQWAAPVALATGPWLVAIVLVLAVVVLSRVETQAREILAQRTAIATRRALMDRMVENSFDGIIITDHESIVRIINNAALGILGFPIEEAMGRRLDLLMPDAARLAASLEPLRAPDHVKEQRAPHELSVVRRAGERIDIELIVGMVNLTPGQRRSTDARWNYHTFTFRDISERKRIRKAEKRVTEEALAANRAKTEFLHNMSHELRTPLNAIIGFSETIQSEIFGPISPPRYLEYVGDILDSGKHLLAIINDVLDVSRIELDQYEIQKDILDPHNVLESSIKIMTGWPNYAERQFQTDVPDALPSIEGDSRVLKQVVINLLSNAVKFSRPGDRIVLRAFIDGEGWLAISISDTGIGIAPEHLPKLTQAFYQVDGELAREYEGTGLGLFLSANFVKLHGGEMRIDSEPDQGTTVTIRLPSVPAKLEGVPPQLEGNPPRAAAVAAQA